MSSCWSNEVSEPLKTNPKDELHDAFEAFNNLSLQLSDSYNELTDRVECLTLELATSKSERIKELQQKEQLAKRLESILHALPAGVIVLDGEGVIQDYNAIALELLGEPLDKQLWINVSNRVFDVSTNSQEIHLKDNRWVTLSTCPLGELPGQIILINEVTERKQQQLEIEKKQRLITMGQTAASLAHQIRTPLSSAILYSSNLKKQTLNNQDRLIISEKIILRLRHLEHIVNDMLVYARGSNSNESDFSVVELMNDLLQMTNVHLQESNIDVEWVNSINGKVLIKGNRQMLVSSLINLVVNAIQAMPDKGKLILKTVEENNNEVEISIQDNGVGIKNDDLDNVFKPFFTTKDDGTGLGLAVVRAVIHAHNGNIKVEQVKPKGTKFKMVIPFFYGEVDDSKMIVNA